jgi:ribosomal protein L20A (L18A)
LRKLKKVKKTNGEILSVNEARSFLLEARPSSLLRPSPPAPSSHTLCMHLRADLRETTNQTEKLRHLDPVHGARRRSAPRLSMPQDHLCFMPGLSSCRSPWFQSQSGTHNMYKEFRDVTLNGAIDQLYNDMAGRHRVRTPEIQIIKTAVVPPHKCMRKSVKQFHDDNLSFPLPHRTIRPDSKSMRTTFKYKRATTAMF